MIKKIIKEVDKYVEKLEVQQAERRKMASEIIDRINIKVTDNGYLISYYDLKDLLAELADDPNLKT